MQPVMFMEILGHLFGLVRGVAFAATNQAKLPISFLSSSFSMLLSNFLQPWATQLFMSRASLIALLAASKSTGD